MSSNERELSRINNKDSVLDIRAYSRNSMTKFIHFTFLLPLLCLILSCNPQSTINNAKSPVLSSFRDIPGVTNEEILAIEALKKKVEERGTPFIVGNPHNTESFISAYGTINGFIPLFCSWLTDFFDIPFSSQLFELNNLLAGVLAGEIDFGTNSLTPERQEIFIMTEPIYYRSLKIMKIQGNLSPYEIIHTRPVRYVFLRSSTNFGVALELLSPGTYELVFANNYDEMYQILKAGAADAMLLYNSAEAAFDIYGDVVVEDFLPLSIVPATLSTGQKELEPIISVISKALKHGAYKEFTAIYRQGNNEYYKNKFLMRLTEEEKKYIYENPVIPFVTQYMSYPDSFFDVNDNTWKGIVFEIMEELEYITGFKFEMKNDNNTDLPHLLRMLESEDAYFIPYLTQSEERAERFIFSDVVYLKDNYSLLSKNSFPNLELNDIPFVRIGFSAGSAFAEMFHAWFPNALYSTEYPNIVEAFNAVEQGKIDLVLTSRSRLLALTNYYEFSDYKANYTFNIDLYASFAFNKNQPVLASIIDKALLLINTDRIVDHWQSVTYNLEAMRLKEQRVWFIHIIILFFISFTALFVVFINNVQKRKTIINQAAELETLLEKTKKISEYELTRHVLNVSAMNIVLWDMELNPKEPVTENSICIYTKEFRNYFGYDNEKEFPNILGSWSNCIHPNDKERVFSAFTAHINDYSGNTPYDNEYRIIRKNGEIRCTRGIGKTLRDSEGRPLRIAGSIEDITEKKEMARAIEQNRMNYINSLENILNSIDALIFVSIPETGEILFVNKNIEKAYKYKKENVIGEKCYKVFRNSDSICEFCKCKELDKNPDKIIIWEEFNTFLNRYFLYSDCYIDWPNGQKVHLHHAKDITDLIEHKISEEKAKAASEAKTFFLANMSHEIRTPMNSIIGFSELARDVNEIDKVKEYLGKILLNAEMLLSIINDILDISKIESGKMELEKIPFYLEDVLSYCYAMVLPKAQEKNLVLDYKINSPHKRKMLGDPVRLRQIILNLLYNAVKFTNSGTVELLASILNSDKTVSILFEVKDSGIGMDRDTISMILKPFAQADSSITRKYGGTGLGLSITKDIIEMMGSELKVESVKGAGSKFSFMLNFEFVPGDNQLYNENKINEIEKPVFNGNVLVCEDNEMNLEVISEHLDRIGLKYELARNGKEGIDLVELYKKEGKNFDLILMDVHMPEMDGLEASSKIIKLGIKTPIIALTANVMAGDLEKYKEHGMNDALGKPFTTRELWECISKYINIV